jgi:hypothetical protein
VVLLGDDCKVQLISYFVVQKGGDSARTSKYSDQDSTSGDEEDSWREARVLVGHSSQSRQRRGCTCCKMDREFISKDEARKEGVPQQTDRSQGTKHNNREGSNLEDLHMPRYSQLILVPFHPVHRLHAQCRRGWSR